MGFFSSGTKDLNIYPMSQGNRSGLAGSAYSQLSGLYGSDPNQFWGGQNAWTTSQGMGPPGGIGWGDLMGGGGGGGARAHAGHANVALGINDPTYALDIPKQQEDALLSRANEMGSAQAGDSWRRTQDELARSGSSGSPAALALQGNIERERLKGVADTHRDVKTDWYNSARQLRNSWNQIATGANIANAGNDTQASVANAGFANSAGQANAARHAAAAQFLMASRGADEDRSLKRYGMLNDMNMGWQNPNAQKTQTPSGFSTLMGGLGSAAGFAGQISGMGGFGGLFGGGGGGGSQGVGNWSSPGQGWGGGNFGGGVGASNYYSRLFG